MTAHDMTKPFEHGSSDQAPCSTVRPCPAYEPTTHDIKEHMHLVFKVVAHFQRRLPSTVLRDDLVAAGTVGLLAAIRKNRRELGTPAFECYARIRIRGAILDELRLLDWAPRRTKANAAARAQSAGAATPAVAPPISVIGLEDLSSSQEPATEAASPETLTETLHLRRALDGALERLPQRERKVLELRYMHDVSSKEIAVMLGVSEARISQLHARAAGAMRELLSEPNKLPKAA